ncbi:2-hydroxyacid dehydrogenase [Kocuria aegyptia]|uniref:2-hydroxyacid dehydrogenase n=1 Tax=Kocuria aegyptia TaxID=330943 RepID=A0ABP4X0H7_9MICC
MNLPLVLVPSPAPKDVLDAIRGRFDLLQPSNQEELDAILTDRGEEIEVIANPGEGPLGKDLLERLPNLRLIAHFGVGYDTVDAPEAVRRGVVVTNVAGSNDEEVADTAMGLLLMTVRELSQAQEHLRRGRWHEGPYPLTRFSLQGRTMGVLGMGHIGQAIARRAAAFGISVSYHARHERNLELPYYPDLRDMARDVDILVVATPGGASTRHLVDAEILRNLGSGGVLINVARGSVVDEQALIATLADGTLGAAGLDVYEDEPNVPPELLALHNAVLLPHVGSGSVPTRRRMAELGAANLQSWFTDGTVLTPVPEARVLTAQ